MKKLTLTFHCDPGHGWMEISKSLISDEIKSQISGYSYVGGSVLYAEEDCDAPLILANLKDRGYQVSLREIHYNTDCFIRNLPSSFQKNLK